ncbi:MAG: cupredoxin domain-containing protein [Actinomycetota bacterium]
MRRHLCGVLVVLIGAALLPMPSHATTNIAVSLINAGGTGDQYDPVIDPRSPLVVPGATITWTNKDSGGNDPPSGSEHALEAYYGATFDSGVLDQGQSASITYGGGTVLYRCLYHSSLSYDVPQGPPTCSGMCGAIHDASSTDRTPPSVTITTENGFVFTAGVRIDGTATDDSAVMDVLVRFIPVVPVPPLIYNPPPQQSDPTSTQNPCAGCDGPYAEWTVRQDTTASAAIPPIALPPGQYRVEAAAFDPLGVEGDATPISIYVLR